jgi:hypothetical protein
MEEIAWPDKELAQRLFEERLKVHDDAGLDDEDAVALANDEVMLARDLCEQRGELDREPDAEWLFKAAGRDPEMAKYLREARADGVTDDDIRAWHARPYLERGVISASAEFETVSTAFEMISGGSDARETGLGAFQCAPVWRAPNEPLDPDLAERPLPFELFPRFERWARSRTLEGEQFERELKAHGSFTHLVRAAAVAGEL